MDHQSSISVSPSRRDFLRDVLVGFSCFLVASTRAEAIGAPMPRKTARGCIFLNMKGGPSQLETWDPKPDAPGGRTFARIRTTLTGVHVSEHLPELAKRARQLVIVRSVTGTESNHARAEHILHTSYPQQLGGGHVPVGAIVARKYGNGLLPGYVAVGGPGHPPGSLGAAYTPFSIRNPRYPTANLTPWMGSPRLERRLDFWRQREDAFLALHPTTDLQERRLVWENALAMSGEPAANAFDIGRETDATRKRYGETLFGQGCLLARRLVESGVPFVEVVLDGWDTHVNNFEQTRVLCNLLDRAMSNLIDDLAARGLLDEILILCLGEFGRTPDVNADAGRDHYPRVSSAVLTGGRLPAGLVIGASDQRGRDVVDRPVTIPDLLRTLALRLGIDPDEQHISPGGRPLNTIDGGVPVSELL